MSLDLILLGLLREPSSGYEIKLWFERAFRHFWAAEPSQIYRTLARLEDSGMLTSREQASNKGPPRRVYRITGRGRATLRAWLRDGPDLSDSRLSHLAQILLLSELPDDGERLAFLGTLRTKFGHLRSELLAVRAGLDGAPGPTDRSEEEFFRFLTLDAGIHQYQSWIAWIDRAHALLTDRAASRPSAPRKERSPS